MIAALMLTLAVTGSSLQSTPATQVETLHCGAADLRLASQPQADPAATLAPVSQRLSRRVGSRQLPVALERGDFVAIRGTSIPDRYVGSWACLTGSHQQAYVLLSYACATAAGADGCGGRHEWFRLLDAHGRFVDAGVADDGAGRERLYARLGLVAAMADGVTLTPVVH